MADLAKLESRVEPQIISKANPSSQDLLTVRADVQSSPRLQNLFMQARTEEWPSERLADTLATELAGIHPEENVADLFEAAQFLADEFMQVGPGIQLISTETGRIAAVIKEEDLYTPAPVPREGTSTLAQPLPRIRPDLEAGIVTWFHDKDREQEVVRALAERGHQTALLRELGDPRLLVATRKGRRHIVSSLSRIDPKDLLRAAGGRAGTFLQMFHLIEDGAPVDEELTLIHGLLSSKSVMGVQDQKTVNLHHNRAATLRAVLVGGWIRELAKLLALEVHRTLDGIQIPGEFKRNQPSTKVVLDLSDPDIQVPSDFWVADPDFIRPLVAKNAKAEVFVVENSRTITIKKDPQKLGYLKVPPQFEAKNLEAFDRWEANAYLSFDMWVDLSRLTPYDLQGVNVTQVL